MKGILVCQFLKFHSFYQNLYADKTALELSKQQCQVIICHWPDDQIILIIVITLNTIDILIISVSVIV